MTPACRPGHVKTGPTKKEADPKTLFVSSVGPIPRSEAELEFCNQYAHVLLENPLRRPNLSDGPAFRVAMAAKLPVSASLYA
jgi:hypothetical protein